MESAFDITERNINKLVSKNVNYNLLLLINRLNESEAENIYKKFGSVTIRPDYIYPIDNNFYSEKYLTSMYDKSKYFIKPSLASFKKCSESNNCFKESLAVSCDGFAYPCVMARTLPLGNVKEQYLYEIIASEKCQEYSALHKGKIEGCKTCHKRYGCLECRALEISATNNITGMKFCNTLE